MNVTLLARSDKESTSIKKSRKLPHNTDYIINEQIVISNNYEKVISNSKIIILAVPSTSINKNVDGIKKYINDQLDLVYIEIHESMCDLSQFES